MIEKQESAAEDNDNLLWLKSFACKKHKHLGGKW